MPEIKGPITIGGTKLQQQILGKKPVAELTVYDKEAWDSAENIYYTHHRSEKIRLGFEEIFKVTDRDGNNVTIPSAWFLGKQGPREDFLCFSDRTYEDLKQDRLTSNMQGYLNEYSALTRLSYDNEWYQFEFNLYKDYIKSRQTFLVPILITSSYPKADLHYLTYVHLPSDLQEYIKQGKAKVLFYTHAEGNITEDHLDRINKFCINNNLFPSEAFLSCSDLNKRTYFRYPDRRFSVRRVNYFAEDLWILPKRVDKRGLQTVKDKILKRYSQENWNETKQKTFLCLNRRTMPHRTFLFGFFKTHPNLEKDTWLSLGTSGVDGFSNKPYTGQEALRYLSKITGSDRDNPTVSQIEEFFIRNRNNSVLQQLDLPDLNMTENPSEVNEHLYRTSFVNVISETYGDSRPYQFITEKTIKSIFSMQPFILVSSKGTLKALREQGYQTFDQWWDEGYDSIEDPLERILAVCKVIEQLSKYSKSELLQMTRDMHSVLYHNAHLLLSSRDLEETLNWLWFIQNVGDTENRFKI